ncbi:MAG TPA: hypothetical protein PKA90_05130 [Ignavibacteria bacterium]|nr:hypothetical protein [Ignavibacteria bacterium]
MQTIKIYKFYGKWTKVFEAREEILLYTYSKFENNICKRDLHNIFQFNGSNFVSFLVQIYFVCTEFRDLEIKT